MRYFLLAAALIAFMASAAAADPERVYGMQEHELEAMSRHLSVMTLAGFEDVPDVRQMTYGEIVRLAITACLRDEPDAFRDEGGGRVSVVGEYVTRAAQKYLGIPLPDLHTARDDGRVYYHDRLRYVFDSVSLPTGPYARVRDVWRDGGLLLWTGVLVGRDGAELGDFYAHVRETGRRGARDWSIVSFLKSKKGADVK